MSAILIIGESGSGKSTSMRNLDPKTTMLVQVIKKDLPFKGKEWKPLTTKEVDGKKTRATGNTIVTRTASEIIRAIAAAKDLGFKVVVIDDLQYMMSYELFDRVNEKSFNKFVDVAVNIKDVFDAARNVEDINVYFLAHSESGEDGTIRMKTSGKMLNNQLTPEGLFTVVLRAVTLNGEHLFLTRNSGDTTKTPIGMFDKDSVDNDLVFVDKKINEYYN